MNFENMVKNHISEAFTEAFESWKKENPPEQLRKEFMQQFHRTKSNLFESAIGARKTVRNGRWEITPWSSDKTELTKMMEEIAHDRVRNAINKHFEDFKITKEMEKELIKIFNKEIRRNLKYKVEKLANEKARDILKNVDEMFK